MAGPPPSPERESGNYIGRYELVRKLATGGMAHVWLAVDRGQHALERLCVVKQVLPTLASDPDTADMFTREARVVARIRHPNVVQIHELGEDGGLPFIVMQYIEGITLQQLLEVMRRTEGARLSSAALVHLLDQSCAALHAAHELTDPSGTSYELVHRDVSPHNLMIDAAAHVTLLDFGIAKDNRAEAQSDATRQGLLKGKIAYMSPEQARQEPLDRRSDVFALGIVAYELLTLRRPFRGNSDLALLHAMVHGERAPLASLRPDVPKSIVEVIDRALALKKQDRWPSADAMRVALLDAARSMGVEVDRGDIASSLQGYVVDGTRSARASGEDVLDRTEVSLPGKARASGTSAPPRSTGGNDTLHNGAGHSGAGNTTGVTATGMAIVGGGFGVLFGGVGALLIAGMLSSACLALVAAGAWWWWQEPEAVAMVAAPGPTAADPAADAVVVMVAPVIDPVVLIEELAPLESFLEPRLGHDLEFRVASDYAAAAGAVLDGTAPFAMLPEATARVARVQEPRLRLLAVKEIDGRSGVDALLVAGSGLNLSADAPDGFRGHTVCFTDPRSSSGHRYPSRWFSERGIDPDTDLKLRVSGSHEQVVADLAAGACEIGATHAGNFEKALADGLLGPDYRVVAITGVTRHDVVVAGAGTDVVLADRLRELLLKYDPDRDAVGKDGSITGFQEVPAEYAGPE